MAALPQARDGHCSNIKVGAYTCFSLQNLEERKSVSQLENRSVISSDLRRKRYLEYDPLKDQFFEEMLVLCDEVFYPLKERFLVKLWKKEFKDYFKVDLIRGLITIDIPITRFNNAFRYSRIVIIPRGFILDAKELEALWTAALSIRRPRPYDKDGGLDSMTIAVFTLKAGEKLPTYRFERLGKRSKVEFMTFVGLPANSMAKFLESLIPFLEKKLKGFLKRFEIPLHYVGYSLGGRGWFIKSKKGGISTSSFTKWRPDDVDYIKNVKSEWLKSALKGLMMLINELVDAYIYKIKPQKAAELKIYYAIRKEAKALRNHRLKPKPIEKRIKRWTEIALLQQSIHLGEGSPLGNLLKSSKPPSYHRRPNLAASEAARG